MTNTQSLHEQCVSAYDHLIYIHDVTYSYLPPSVPLSLTFPPISPYFPLSYSFPSDPLCLPLTLSPFLPLFNLLLFPFLLLSFHHLPSHFLSLALHQVKCSDVLYGCTSSKLRTLCRQTTEGSQILTLKCP